MENPAESLIALVLWHYYPDWEIPEDRREWNQCICPDHSERRPSASVSFERNAIKCMACGFKGDAISIIKEKEGLAFGEAVKRAEEISGRSDVSVSRKPSRKSGRRTFGGQGTRQPERSRGGRTFSPGLRG